MSHSRSDFKKVKALTDASANGGFNQGIYLVKSRVSGTKYIEKRVDREAISSGYAKREVKAMLQWTDHPNIVCIVGHDIKDSTRLGYGSIFMQHCELGSADGIIEQYAKRRECLADEGFLWKVFWDISLALSSLWTGQGAAHIRERALAGKTTDELDEVNFTRVIHRDVKPANLFLTRASTDGQPAHYPRVVLGDWGCSVTTQDIRAGRIDMKVQSCMTRAFAPPEAPRYFARSDMYQLALSIQCLACMSDNPDPDRYPAFDPLPSKYQDPGLRKLLEECLQRNPQHRPYPGDLPMKVINGMGEWMMKHGSGKKLERWAFS